MSDFDTLMNHLRQARSLAASLHGSAIMTNADQLHEMVDDCVEYAATHCWFIDPTQARAESREEDECRERVIAESAGHFINGY